MRILHTSDWHLGQNFYGKSRAKEHQQFLSWLLEQVEEHHIDAIIVAGDIFDTGTPPSYAREMYFDFIVNIHKIHCQLIVLAGNHDSVAMLGESKQLLANLSTRVIPAVSDNLDEQVFSIKKNISKDIPEIVDKNNALNKSVVEQVVICAIPFIRPRDVIKSQAGQSATQKQQGLQQSISGHYQSLFDHAQLLAKQLSSEEALSSPSVTQETAIPIIATGHLTTVGVTTSESVRDIYIGTLEAFPANAFPAADYIALGHIHRAQTVAKTDHIRYSGSPIPLSFDEAKQDKSVFMVDFVKNEKIEVTSLIIPCFQPLLMIKATLDNLSTQLLQAVDNIKSNGQFKPDDQMIWLDIEIESADYLHDLQSRIKVLIQDLPVEILLVRRSKKSRALMPSSQKKITLNELTLDEVFDSRLEQESWDSEEQQARKTRLENLFQQTLNQVQTSDTETHKAETNEVAVHQTEAKS